MRILIHSLNAAPEPVGIGKYSGELAAHLADRGHEVDVLCSPPYYPSWSIETAYRGVRWIREQRDGATYLRAPIRIGSRDRIGATARVALETSFTVSSLRWWLPILMARSRYDIVYSVCPPLQSALLPTIYRSVRRVPWVLHIQDFQLDAALRLGMLPDNVAGRTLYRLESNLLKRATMVTTITESMASRAREKGVDPARVRVTPNWSDLQAIRPMRRENPLRTRFNAGQDQTLLLYAGNIGEKQGLEVLMEAATMLRAREDLVFAVVGEGVSRARLEAEATRRRLPNLRFFDLVSATELPTMLAAADVHLVLQRAEAADLVMPSKLTNIMAAGRPTLATAMPGTELHSVLVSSEAGRVVPPGDAVTLANAIVAMASNPAERAAQGVAARHYAERALSSETVLPMIEDLLAEVCQAHPTHA